MGILSDGSVCGDSGGIALGVVPRVSTLYERARESESGSLLKPGGLRGKDQKSGIGSTLEWNPGNHFRDPGLRTAKAFAWVMKNS